MTRIALHLVVSSMPRYVLLLGCFLKRPSIDVQMLHLCPDSFRREHLQDFIGLPGRMAAKNEILGVESTVGIGWMSQDLNHHGVCGNALAADATRGCE